jgi:hypothetical protein
MPIWRRDDEEPAHERLAREAGIDLDAGASGDSQPDPFPSGEGAPFVGTIREPGITGIHRQREWDAVASADAPDLAGDAIEFTTLPDGTLLVEGAIPDGALAPLADALEQSVAPPYRARAVRNDDRVWSVAANAIDVLQVPEDIPGDTVSLAVQGGERTLLVDERPAWERIPTLEDYAAAEYAEFVLYAERLDGDLWEVKVNAL